MKNQSTPITANVQQDKVEPKIITLERAKAIMQEEGIEYSNEELREVLDFVAKVISISTDYYERLKGREAKIISIDSNKQDETKSISIHSGKYGRTG